MENGMTNDGLLRMIGFMTICVGIAWVAQILGLSQEGTTISRFVWVMAAASVSGAGAGLVVIANGLTAGEAIRAEA